MPTPLIKSYAEKSGNSVKHIEKMWTNIERSVRDHYTDKTEDEIYALVNGILKKVLKFNEESQASTTTASAGNVSSYGGAGNYAPKIGMMSRRGDLPSKKKKCSLKEAVDYMETFPKRKGV